MKSFGIFPVVCCLLLIATAVSAQTIEVTVNHLTENTGMITIMPLIGTRVSNEAERKFIERIECVINKHDCLDTLINQFQIDSIFTNHGLCGRLWHVEFYYHHYTGADSQGRLQIYYEYVYVEEPTSLSLRRLTDYSWSMLYHKNVEVVSTHRQNNGLLEVIYRKK